MLIFFLDLDPAVAASLVPNGHMKLAVECGQLFRAAMWHHTDQSTKPPGYYRNPFTLWLKDSEFAWDWLMGFAEAVSCREYPTRYAENQRKRARPYHGAWYSIAETVVKPAHFRFRTMEETPLCPLPKNCPVEEGFEATTHAQRVLQFRIYHVACKNLDNKRFLYEPRARRPAYLPRRTEAQEALVAQDRKRLKL